MKSVFACCNSVIFLLMSLGKGKTIDADPLICTDSTIHVKVKLAEQVNPSGSCGIFRFTGLYKFELLERSGKPVYIKQYVLIKFTCPGDMGKNYFRKGYIYKFVVQQTTDKNVMDYPSVKTTKNTIAYDLIQILSPGVLPFAGPDDINKEK